MARRRRRSNYDPSDERKQIFTRWIHANQPETVSTADKWLLLDQMFTFILS